MKDCLHETTVLLMACRIRSREFFFNVKVPSISTGTPAGNPDTPKELLELCLLPSPQISLNNSLQPL